MTRWLLIVAITVVVAGATARAEEPKPDLGKVVNTAAFATDLYAKVAEKKGNLFFSPLSIETALAMTYAGAKGNTAEQMVRVLHYKASPDKVAAAFAKVMKSLSNPPGATDSEHESGKPSKKSAYQLVLANALWGQDGYPFNPDFTQLVQKSYGASINSVDFVDQAKKARTTINDWAATQTKNKIKDLLAKDALTADTRLVLTNAIYFKSGWTEKFGKSETKDGPFKLTTEKSVDVPLMHQSDNFGYWENDDMQVLDLPYVQHELSMVVVLPKKVDGLAAVEKALTLENLGQWLKGKKIVPVEVTLPKFTFSAEMMLADILKAMGMGDAFDAEKADLSGMTAKEGMTKKEKLYLSAVIHKAFVAVDEEGTEAAAVTAGVDITLGVAPPPPPPKVFKADHPFLFLIRHNATGETLFVGRLANPKGE